MSIGSSGRIVIEVDPTLKARLHDALRARDTTLKDWFLRLATIELAQAGQLSLALELPMEPGEPIVQR